MAGSRRSDLEQALASHTLIGLDTSLFIYHFEAHPRYLSLTTEILGSIQSGRRESIISVVTLMELTVLPYRMNQPQAAAEYEALLVHFPNLRLVDVTRDIARRAAQLRASYTLRPADALLVATAVEGGATAFVTNDKALVRLTPLIDILLLQDFL
jgi:predicted nucleic acid-binding protein